MTELLPAGYRWLRSQIYQRWRYLAVLDTEWHEIARIDTQTDPRIARTINDATGEIEFDLSLRGADPEFSALLPVRIGATVLLPDAAGGESRSRVTYTHIIFTGPEDGAVLPHRLHIPVMALREAI